MDVRNTVAGSLQISTDVVAKIAATAAQEVDGVVSVASGSQPERAPAAEQGQLAQAGLGCYGGWRGCGNAAHCGQIWLQNHARL